MATNSSGSKPFPFNPAISRMRALCALLVALGHFEKGLFSPDWNHTYYAVTVFFTISGFLITTNVLTSDGSLRALAVRKFYAKRVSRIFPPLFLLVTLLCFGHLAGISPFVFSKESCGLKGALSALFTLRFNKLFTATSATLPLMWGVLWSLTIEETFYLVFPPICKLMPSLFFYPLTAVLVGVGLTHRNSSPNGGLYDFFSCFDSLALGVTTALLAKKFESFTSHKICSFALPYAIFGIAYVYATMPPSPPDTTVAPLLIAVLSSIILFIVSNSKPNERTMKRDPLVRLGSYSYEIYLFHGAIYAFFTYLMARASPGVVFTLSTPVVLGVSASIAIWYSEPVKDYTKGLILRFLRFVPNAKSGAPEGRPVVM